MKRLDRAEHFSQRKEEDAVDLIDDENGRKPKPALAINNYRNT